MIVEPNTLVPSLSVESKNQHITKEDRTIVISSTKIFDDKNTDYSKRPLVEISNPNTPSFIIYTELFH